MVKLFLDTDIGPDCDDAGALQIIHALCDQGKAELLGVTHCTSSPYGLPTISAINRYNRREVPLGTTRRRGFLDDGQCLRYTRPISEAFDHEFKGGRVQREAGEILCEVLAGQRDGSVTMLAIGPLNNLADYLKDTTLHRLIARKVQRLVCMAGRFDQALAEWNISSDIAAARAVFERWPSEIVACGWECGAGVITGAALHGRADSPVRAAYDFWTGGTLRRDSWDLAAALYAVLGDSGWIYAGQPGRVTITGDGVSLFALPREKARTAIDAAPGRKAIIVMGARDSSLRPWTATL